MMDRIRDWFWRTFKQRSWRPRRTYSHGISVLGSTAKGIRVTGWLVDLPQPGDALRLQMKSSRVGLFRFVDVEWCRGRDPEDMFFGTAWFVLYEVHPLAPGSPGTEPETSDQRFEREWQEFSEGEHRRAAWYRNTPTLSHEEALSRGARRRG